MYDKGRFGGRGVVCVVGDVVGLSLSRFFFLPRLRLVLTRLSFWFLVEACWLIGMSGCWGYGRGRERGGGRWGGMGSGASGKGIKGFGRRGGCCDRDGTLWETFLRKVWDRRNWCLLLRSSTRDIFHLSKKRKKWYLHTSSLFHSSLVTTPPSSPSR